MRRASLSGAYAPNRWISPDPAHASGQCAAFVGVSRRVKAACLVVLFAASAATLYAGAASAEVHVYDSTQLAFDRYTVVKRLWVQDWRSAFSVGAQPTELRARQALLDEARRLGADGVINLTCFDQTDRIFSPSGYFCYGNAIRVKK